MVFLKTCSIVLILCHTIKKNMQLETSRKNVQSYIDKQMKFLLLSLYMPKHFSGKQNLFNIFSVLQQVDINLISLFNEIREKYKMLCQ